MSTPSDSRAQHWRQTGTDLPAQCADMRKYTTLPVVYHFGQDGESDSRASMVTAPPYSKSHNTYCPHPSYPPPTGSEVAGCGERSESCCIIQWGEQNKPKCCDPVHPDLDPTHCDPRWCPFSDDCMVEDVSKNYCLDHVDEKKCVNYCQKFQPSDKVKERPPWCDIYMKLYCKKHGQGSELDKLNCACFNSTIIQPACFDPDCAQSGWMTSSMIDNSKHCPQICGEIINIAKSQDVNLNMSQFTQQCGADAAAEVQKAQDDRKNPQPSPTPSPTPIPIPPSAPTAAPSPADEDGDGGDTEIYPQPTDTTTMIARKVLAHPVQVVEYYYKNDLFGTPDGKVVLGLLIGVAVIALIVLLLLIYFIFFRKSTPAASPSN